MPCGLTASLAESTRSDLLTYCDSLIVSTLVESGVRVKGDMRDNYSPGWKFNHWEQKVGNCDEILIST